MKVGDISCNIEDFFAHIREAQPGPLPARSGFRRELVKQHVKAGMLGFPAYKHFNYIATN